MDTEKRAAAQSQARKITAGKPMRIATAIATLALLFGTSASGAITGVQLQPPRPRVAPPPPRTQPAPIVTLPFAACDRIPQPPRYPARAPAIGEQGAVTLWIFVAATGRIREALVANSSSSVRLDEAAIASTRSWILEPGRQGTRPTGMWTQAVVSFLIPSSESGSARVEIQFPKAADINRCLA